MLTQVGISSQRYWAHVGKVERHRSKSWSAPHTDFVTLDKECHLAGQVLGHKQRSCVHTTHLRVFLTSDNAWCVCLQIYKTLAHKFHYIPTANMMTTNYTPPTLLGNLPKAAQLADDGPRTKQRSACQHPLLPLPWLHPGAYTHCPLSQRSGVQCLATV